ncbi:MAG TPA: PadR family transcriptional regulator [Candidatus Acidoferrum sp.]
MGLRIRLSKQTLMVLDALLTRPGQWQHGYSLSQNTSIPSGTLYPILMRLEKLQWLETRWEEAKTPGRPPRHLYRLSGTAREWAREEIRAARERRFWKPAEHEV